MQVATLSVSRPTLLRKASSKGTDFDQVSTPVGKHLSLRKLLAVVADEGLEVDQLDESHF
jgi:hypothetical protein